MTKDDVMATTGKRATQVPPPLASGGPGGLSVQPAQQTSGCSSSGAPGALGLLLLGVLALRRKQGLRATPRS